MHYSLKFKYKNKDKKEIICEWYLPERVVNKPVFLGIGSRKNSPRLTVLEQ